MIAPVTIESEKLRRIRDGEPPRVLDLFSGCGGFSLGFQQAGFEIVGGVESDPDACRTYAANLHPGAAGTALERHRHRFDITKRTPTEVLEALTRDGVDRAIDVVIGGPPCPAFTRIGRAKLRSVGGRADAHVLDARAQLWRRYLDFVAELKPIAVVLENVPDMRRWNGTNVARVICDALAALGFACKYEILNAAHFGVPQFRTRLFLVGLHRSVEEPFLFPAPSHAGVVPRGYVAAVGAVAPKSQGLLLLQGAQHAAEPNGTAPFVSFSDATRDLPDLAAVSLPRIPDLSAVLPYSGAPTTDYARKMRLCAPLGRDGGVTAHACRRPSERDMRIFAAMQPGDDYPVAYEKAFELLDEHLAARSSAGDLGEGARVTLERAYVPPYSPSKFPNKWWKIVPELPCRTLTAHLGKDCYSHIHPGPAPRTISVREAARLQGFPDWTTFPVGLNAAMRQIGNAVPPPLAAKLAERLLESVGVRASVPSPKP